MTITNAILCILVACLLCALTYERYAKRDWRHTAIADSIAKGFDFAKYIDNQSVLLIRKSTTWYIFVNHKTYWTDCYGKRCSQQLASVLDDIVDEILFRLD